MFNFFRKKMSPTTLRFIKNGVPGGWLVIAAVQIGGKVSHIGVTFVPDPNHMWDRVELEGAQVQ